MKTLSTLFLFVFSLKLIAAKELKWLSFPATMPDQAAWADGDSFKINFKHPETKQDSTETLRLYFVDCPESIITPGNKSDVRRLRAQARYFGIDDPKTVLKFGKLASKRTAALLRKPFKVETKFAQALGRSKKSRIYGVITLHDGRDLASVLISEGLARSYGKTTKLSNQVSGKAHMDKLKDMELVSAIEKKGLWSVSDPKQLLIMRENARKEEQALKQFFKGGTFSPIDKENPVDINNATALELTYLNGIGDATSRKIVLNRPYKAIEDLLKIKGIGKATINKLRPYLKVGPVKKSDGN